MLTQESLLTQTVSVAPAPPAGAAGLAASAGFAGSAGLAVGAAAGGAPQAERIASPDRSRLPRPNSWRRDSERTVMRSPSEARATAMRCPCSAAIHPGRIPEERSAVGNADRYPECSQVTP